MFLAKGLPAPKRKEAIRKARPPMTLRRDASQLFDRAFFDRSPEMVARDLLGTIRVHRREGTRLSGRIIETEAYLGLSDPASAADCRGWIPMQIGIDHQTHRHNQSR